MAVNYIYGYFYLFHWTNAYNSSKQNCRYSPGSVVDCIGLVRMKLPLSRMVGKHTQQYNTGIDWDHASNVTNSVYVQQTGRGTQTVRRQCAVEQSRMKLHYGENTHLGLIFFINSNGGILHSKPQSTLTGHLGQKWRMNAPWKRILGKMFVPLKIS